MASRHQRRCSLAARTMVSVDKKLRRPQYRVISRLLRLTTSELLLRGLDENGIRLRGTERRRERLVKKVLKVMERLNAWEAARR